MIFGKNRNLRLPRTGEQIPWT